MIKVYAVLFSTIGGGRASIPDWVVPASLRSGLESVVNKFKSDIEKSSDELASIAPEFGQDIFLPLKLTSSGYMGVSGVSESAFSKAFSDCEINREKTKECDISIAKFWIDRPLWFLPSVPEIEHARFCVIEILESISSSTRPDPESLNAGLVLSQTVFQLIPVLFSPKAIVFTRSNRSALSGISNIEEKLLSRRFGFFQQFLHAHPKILNMLSVSAKVSSSNEHSFPNHLLHHSHNVHIGDYLDFSLPLESFAQNAKTTLPLWKAFAELPELDRDTLRFEAGKQPVIDNAVVDFRTRISFYDVQMGSGIATWLRTVGSLFRYFWQSSPNAMRACLPNDAHANEVLYTPNSFTWSTINLSDFSTLRQVYYYLTDNVKVVPTLYLCVADKVESSEINIDAADPNYGEYLATLLHLVKLGTSPSAFIIENS